MRKNGRTRVDLPAVLPPIHKAILSRQAQTGAVTSHVFDTRKHPDAVLDVVLVRILWLLEYSQARARNTRLSRRDDFLTIDLRSDLPN